MTQPNRPKKSPNSSRRRRFRSSVTSIIVLGLVVTAAADAPAVWPPPESATPEDLSKPENWPNDPGYGYSDSTDGHWHYYSFVPPQDGVNELRESETAAGMSVDLAWRYTQGDDSVRIAVTDSGINWDKLDLINQVWLNPAELMNHKPLRADSTACADLDIGTALDCNGDGIFTVADYTDTPTLQPPATGNNPRGDVNGNGVLDAGDLISQFSDGVDDDGNSYVDDIAGWDFMKDDNNPYDDTRYGHGTGEASDSTSEGNNGIDSIGACPKCRFIPMRVGDSFIADTNAFAQAVIYATDNGASVVQSALGTINMTRFTQEALDYAFKNNVLTVASMADENSRHHNMPTTANHTLPVHAITYAPSSRITNVNTFLDFNTCTNYGGQNFLSASGTACSSEAVGHLAGMSGLLYSAALKYQVSPPLTAGEAMQLWITTADDIDVPESREPGSEYSWSQPGFDQRFGYGRINANSAVERVRAGQIPPVVDMTSPTWFEVLYADQLEGPVEIKGLISARRATSYDYIVEWAPGVQPLEDTFETIAMEDNVPSSVITGEEDAIALFDVRTINFDPAGDTDSPLGENDLTITVRIRAVAHYGGQIGDVIGEMRRNYAVQRDPDLVAGFPIYLGDSGEASPKLADIDGDGNRDLIYATSGGRLMVYSLKSGTPEPVDGFPFVAERLDGLRNTPPAGKPRYLDAPAYANGDVDPALGVDSFLASPAVADLDEDGTNEIVVTAWNGTVYVLGNDGAVKPGWPVRLPEVPSCPRDGTGATGPCMSVNAIIDRGAFAAPVIADMDNDGDLDIIQAAFDGKVYIWDRDGAALPGWPVDVHYAGPLADEPARGRVMTTPSVGDFNGDGIPEVLVGSNETLGGSDGFGAVYLIDGRGTNATPTYMTNWPVTIASFNLFPLAAEGVSNSPVIGAIDGTTYGVAHGNGSPPFLMPLDPGAQAGLGQLPPNVAPQHVDPSSGELKPGLAPGSLYGPLSTADAPDTFFPLFGQPSLGDVDQDGVIDVVASGANLSLATSLLGGKARGQHLLGVWSGKTGYPLPAMPVVVEDYSFFNSHAIADINGDDYPEVISGTGGYRLNAIDGCGRQPEGWPKFTNQWIIPTPAVGDLDGDGTLEVVVGTRNGWLYAWHTAGTTDAIVEWESFHHDNRNTGNKATPLDQGTPGRQAAEPLTEALCRDSLSPELPPLVPAGGSCDACAVGSTGQHGPLWPGALVLAGLSLAVTRRKHR